MAPPEWYIGWYTSMEWVEGIRSELLTPIMMAFTEMMHSWFWLSFLALGFWFYRKDLFVRLGVITFIAAIINVHLKAVFVIARPDTVPWLIEASGWSFPSGHAQRGATMCLWFAYEMRRTWAWVVGIICAIGIAVSRLYLGVHTPLDIAAGLLLGVAIVAFFAWLLKRRLVWWHKLPAWVQILAVFVALLLWIITIPDQESVRAASRSVALLIGFWVGAVLEREQLGYVPATQWWRIAIAAVLGLSVIHYQRGIAAAAMASAGIPNIVASRTGPFLWGIMVTWILPWLFIRLRLASRSKAVVD